MYSAKRLKKFSENYGKNLFLDYTVQSGKSNRTITGNMEERGEYVNRESDSMINNQSILTGMSHEMRTNMNAIVAFSFLMNNGNFSEKEKSEFSNHILNSCEQLMSLFDNFLDSAIIDTGNSKADSKSCNLDKLVGDIVSEMRSVLKRHHSSDLVLILENQVKNKEDIFIDTIRVTRVLHNLFRNALCHTSSGYIKIGYRLNEGEITFYVLDSGEGYQKSADFIRSGNLQVPIQKYNDTATAINLIATKKMVELMGGTIWVENNGISGSGLFFRIPYKKAVCSNVPINKYINTKIAI